MIGIERNVLRHVLSALLVAGACSTLPAGAAEPAGLERATGGDPATTRVLGVELSFDAQTGRLVPPTPEIVQQLRATLAAAYAATREQADAGTLADGTRSVVPGERHAAFSIARFESDGRVSMRCVTGAESAEALLIETDAAAAPRGEE
jgi:hypothetical protein